MIYGLQFSICAILQKAHTLLYRHVFFEFMLKKPKTHTLHNLLLSQLIFYGVEEANS